MADNRNARLTVYLGYAAGVGKTYQMLEDAERLTREGVDVVIGYFEPHGRNDTIAKARVFEMVPRKKLIYRGATFEEMDTEAVLRRHPRLVLVDELAHTNIPGSEREKRWQDVLVLLEAGIDVFTTMNVQHLESLNDQVAEISGIRMRETMPDWVLAKAGEVVMVDLTPQALLNRLERGVVYPPEKARKAMENFFKEPTLVALRELALRQTAHEVDARQQPSPPILAPAADSSEPERILLLVTADPATAALIRRARRMADYLKADCFAVCVQPTAGLRHLDEGDRSAIEKHLHFARSLHVDTRLIPGKDEAQAVVEFARVHRITQIFLARPNTPAGFWERKRDTLVKRIVRMAGDMQVTVVANRRR